MGYTIKNSAAKNTMFTAGGTAISTTTQPNLKGSTLGGVLDSSIPADNKGLVPASDKKRVYTGHDNVSIIDGITNILNNASNTVLRSPGSDRGGRIPFMKVNAVRTNKTATAVRNGYWNSVSGQFQTTGGRVYPDTANDYAAVRVDRETLVGRALGGIHNYNYGANVATGVAYSAKTQ